MALINCKECSEKVSKKAKICPNCGAEVAPKHHGCGVLIMTIILAMIFVPMFFN